MRVLGVVGLIILILETVLGLAFWGGTVWIGGWEGGVILLSVAILLLILPWVGNLVIEYNFLTGQADFKLGWIGRIITGTVPEQEKRFRFLFISWRTHPGSRKQRRQKIRKEAGRNGDEIPGRQRILEDIRLNMEPFSRMASAFLHALNELIWDSDEISISVQAPTQINAADQTLARLVGSRWMGPVYLKVKGEGERQLLVRYRIGLLRVALIGLYAYLQGRPLQAVAAIKTSARKDQPMESKSR